MRSFRRVTLATAFVAVAALVVVAAGGPSAAPRQAEAAPLLRLGRAHPARFLPPLDGSRPIFILVLGSDARPGQVVARARADSIHIVAINPAKKRASVLGFPRDSWVSIPGYGTNKINAAMVAGGPPLMIRTIESLTGIRLDYYALTSFGGLKRIVDGIGGITVTVPYSMNDPFSGAHLSAGQQRLNGHEALAFSRNRKDTPRGDFSRSENQGRLMLGALAQFRREFAKDPTRMLDWIGAGMRNIQTDLSLSELISLAFTAAQIPATKVRNAVVPGSTGFAGSASVVFLGAGARSMYASLRADGIL